MMTSEEMRAKSVDELNKELEELLRQQFNLRMQKSNFGQSGTVRPHEFKEVRRQIARVKTILHEKRQGA